MKLILSAAVLPNVVFLKIWLEITVLRFPQSYHVSTNRKGRE